LAVTIADPVEQVKKMIAADQYSLDALERFFFSGTARAPETLEET